jgi:hypothetical protein
VAFIKPSLLNDTLLSQHSPPPCLPAYEAGKGRSD